MFQGAGHPGSYTEIDCKLPDSCDKVLRSLSKLRGPLAGCHTVSGAAWPGFYGDCRLPDGCDNVPWSSSKLRGPLAGCHAVSGAAWPGFYGDCRLPDGCDNVPWSSSKLRGPLAGCHAVSEAAWPGFYGDCRLPDDNALWSLLRLRGSSWRAASVRGLAGLPPLSRLSSCSATSLD